MTEPVRIISDANPVIKLAAELETPHGRRKRELILVEGLRAAETVAGSGSRIEAALFTSKALKAARTRALADRLGGMGVKTYELPPELYATATRVETPQGVALLCAPPRVALADALLGAFVLVADRLQDPGNLGTLLRSAAAFGVDAVITTKGTADAGNPKALRAAAGAWPGILLAEGVDPDRLLGELAGRGFRVLVADAGGAREFREAEWRGRVALVVGSEAHGADGRLRAGGAQAVRIPLAPGVESLNVTAAAAVILAEASRQRRDEAAGAGPDAKKAAA